MLLLSAALQPCLQPMVHRLVQVLPGRDLLLGGAPHDDKAATGTS